MRTTKLLTGLSLASVLVLAAPVEAGAQPAQEDAAQRVRAAVSKIGSGLKSRVKVRLRDGAKLEGFVNRVGADDFELVSTESGSLGRGFTVRYDEVAKLGGRGVNVNWLKVAAKTAAGAQLFSEYCAASVSICRRSRGNAHAPPRINQCDENCRASARTSAAATDGRRGGLFLLRAEVLRYKHLRVI